MNSLTGQVMGRSDDGGLSHAIVLDESALDLRGRQTVSRDVDDISIRTPESEKKKR